MANQSPKIVEETLSIGESATAQTIRVGSTAWFAWLDTVDCFTYCAAGARYTARKQQRRNGRYWYAFAKHGERMQSVYLGRSTDITLERLQEALRKLFTTDAHPRARYTETMYGAYASKTRATRRWLHSLYERNTPNGVPALNLEQVQIVTVQFARMLTQQQQFRCGAGAQVLDLVQVLTTALEEERLQSGETIARLRRALHDARQWQLPQEDRGEVF